MSTQLPDSNGFWRDINDNIWAYDGNTSNPFTTGNNHASR